MLVDMSAAQGNAKVTVLKDLKGEVQISLVPEYDSFIVFSLTTFYERNAYNHYCYYSM